MRHLFLLVLLVAGCDRGPRPKLIAYKDFDTKHACICNFGYPGWDQFINFQDSCHFYRVGDTLKP